MAEGKVPFECRITCKICGHKIVTNNVLDALDKMVEHRKDHN